MSGRDQGSNALFAPFGESRNSPRSWLICFCAALHILFAASTVALTTSVDAAESGETNKTGHGRPALAVAPSLDVEPLVPTEFYVRVGGPTGSLPPDSVVQIDNLPGSVRLSEGRKTPAGSWVVPLPGLERLSVTAPAGLPQRSEFIISLVDGDGKVLARRTIGLNLTPAVINAQTDKKVEETQRPRIAVSADPPDRKSADSVRPTTTKEERAQAERLVSQGVRHLGEGNIASARQYFLRAAELGLPIAAFKMGETHDPSALAGIHLRGLVPDPVEARKWYERARELGVPEADARLRRMGGR